VYKIVIRCDVNFQLTHKTKQKIGHLPIWESRGQNIVVDGGIINCNGKGGIYCMEENSLGEGRTEKILWKRATQCSF
jgi:hypothetical protein